MDIEPSGAVESLGTALGIPAGQVEGDLKHFKAFIERRGEATGAWRGEVEQDDVTGSRGTGSSADTERETRGRGTERELAGASAMGTSGSEPRPRRRLWLAIARERDRRRQRRPVRLSG